MGVPKFFRWMSERYPAISQLIAENRIPEFDCLYLDMNGIIHNCSHKDSDATHRISEDQMYIAIFNYIEHLFGKIRPKKLFFLAIDGVAPRAKMNQQRSRRFRSARDAERAREKAIADGIELPKEDPFDSNAITPGTEFMEKLTLQLKYFINKKITEDSDWQNVEVVLSGHETPGEGEHKIMEYIRQARSQPGYDPNIRHCLYGLDADLIMLGLLSHDPHFCLLREEVTFGGRQPQKKSKELEHQNFHLMHLCVVREYLELEFQDLKKPGVLDFPVDMERVIDDFILMGFFVGNDFLPSLPHLHINEGALALMFETYKKVLPKAGGYLNEHGYINLKRLGLLIDELTNVEYRFFESDNSDASWLKSKQRLDVQEAAKPAKRGQLVITTPQKEIFRNIKKWINENSNSMVKSKPYNLPSTLPASDREFVKTLAQSLHLEWKTIEDDRGDRHLQISFPPPIEVDVDGDDDEDEEGEAEAQTALFRVIKRYENAKIVDTNAEEAQDEAARKYQEMFIQWRDDYYRKKLGWGLDNEEELRKMTENYVQGLQWVLFYYYRGVASWPWFYASHYSPMISDIKKGFGADMDFKLGQPFLPFQQLMGVLPDRSKRLVPTAYWDLMTSPESPIADFYPRNFELDMNGKKQEWEAVVKIPFIQEDRLLAAMATKEHELKDNERKRNTFGVTLKFTYSSNVDYTYPSPLPGVFNDVPNCHCIENIYELPTMEGLDVHVGLIDGVKLGVASLAGFPSLKVLPFAGALGFHGVTVFQQESRNETMVVTFLQAEARAKIEAARKKIGQVVYVGYPFLQEARVVKVSDELFDYIAADEQAHPGPLPHDQYRINDWHRKANRIETVYSTRLGMVIGSVEALVHVELLKGLRKTDKGDVVKEYAEIPGMEHEYAAQTVVDEIVSPDERFLEKAALPVEEEFPIGTRAFFLGPLAYGRPLEVYNLAGDDKVDIWVAISKTRNDTWGRALVQEADKLTPYTPSYSVARMLQLNPLVLSKITASFSVESSGLRLNLGLNLKFEAKKQKVLGYSRKSENGWEFSEKAIELIKQYMIGFPEFIAGIQRNPKGDVYHDTDFYPAETAAAKMKEIGAWLKSIESKRFERVPLDAEQLDSNAVARIEQVADSMNVNNAPPQNKRVQAVPRHALLKPADAEHRLNAQKFVVGDRVVYVQDSGKVPLGLTGTIVGITRTSRTTLLDVICDSSFMSGTSLGDRCSAFRGATVPSSSVLNLTERQVLADTRASSTRQHQPSNSPMYTNGYGAPTGPGGQGQLFHARAPPPLTGSFRGAVSGQQQGGNAGMALPIRGGRPGGESFGQQRGNGASRAYRGPHHPQRANGGGSESNRGRTGLGFTPVNQNNNNHSQDGETNTRGRGRGRGSGFGNGRGGANNNAAPNKQGYTIIDQADPTAGVVKHNPNFRKQHYNAAPPPKELSGQSSGSARGKAGTWGRGRGRGGSNNGAAAQQ